MTTGPRQLTEVVIEPRAAGVGERLRELWRYRRLLGYFGDRAVEKRTARTLLGRAWLVLRPAMDIGIKAFIFGVVLGVPSGAVPYLLFFLVGMTIWYLFDYGLLWSTRSIEMNRRLVTKLYFPRLLLPLASVKPALLEFGVCCILIAVAILGYGIVDGEWYLSLEPRLLLAPAAVLLCLALSTAIGLFTSVLGATTRDMRFSLRYITGFWFYVTPVIYPVSLLPDYAQPIAQVNPLTPIVEMFKLGLLGEGEVEPLAVVTLLAVIAVVGVAGVRYFVRAEASSVDSI